MKKKLLVGLATGLLMLGVGRMATAALTVNVAFGTSSYSGIGAAPDAGTVWNGLSYNGGSNLLNSNGTATGISVGTTASEAFSDGGTSETPAQTAKEAQRGDKQAQILLAKEKAEKDQ